MYLLAILKAFIVYILITLGFLFIYTMYQNIIKNLNFSQAFSIIFKPIFYSNNLILFLIILSYFLYQVRKEISLF